MPCCLGLLAFLEPHCVPGKVGASLWMWLRWKNACAPSVKVHQCWPHSSVPHRLSMSHAYNLALRTWTQKDQKCKIDQPQLYGQFKAILMLLEVLPINK